MAACLRAESLRTHLAASGRPLSGSQARRLMLARALAGAPRLLLVDDLVDTLSGRARDKVLDALLGEARTATTVLVTRDPEVARRCDRTVELTRTAPLAGATVSVGRVA